MSSCPSPSKSATTVPCVSTGLCEIQWRAVQHEDEPWHSAISPTGSPSSRTSNSNNRALAFVQAQPTLLALMAQVPMVHHCASCGRIWLLCSKSRTPSPSKSTNEGVNPSNTFPTYPQSASPPEKLPRLSPTRTNSSAGAGASGCGTRTSGSLLRYCSSSHAGKYSLRLTSHHNPVGSDFSDWRFALCQSKFASSCVWNLRRNPASRNGSSRTACRQWASAALSRASVVVCSALPINEVVSCGSATRSYSSNTWRGCAVLSSRNGLDPIGHTFFS